MQLSLNRQSPGYYTRTVESLTITVSNPSYLTGARSEWQLNILDGDGMVVDTWFKTKKECYQVAVNWLTKN